MSVDELIGKIASEILSPLITFFVVAAVVVFFWGVVEYMAGAGGGEGRAKGKRHIIWGLVGLFIMLAVAGILQVVRNFWASL